MPTANEVISLLIPIRFKKNEESLHQAKILLGEYEKSWIETNIELSTQREEHKEELKRQEEEIKDLDEKAKILQGNLERDKPTCEFESKELEKKFEESKEWDNKLLQLKQSLDHKLRSQKIKYESEKKKLEEALKNSVKEEGE